MLVIGLLLLACLRAAWRLPSAATFGRLNPVAIAARKVASTVSPSGAADEASDLAIDATTADIVTATTGWADESSCIDCHDQATDFLKTGHARTLHPASSAFSRDRLLQLNDFPKAQEDGITIVAADDQVTAVSDQGDYQRQLRLDWCFGSGTHACTWVSTLPDSRGNTDLLEFRFSWFAQHHGFDITPGQSPQAGVSAVTSLGVLFDGPKAQRCFSCHATVVPTVHGQIQEAGIRPGVMCQRCHGPRAQHVASEGEYHPPAWQIKDRMDSVLRCAVCHRLAEEKAAEDIYPGNPDIVRFQPIGLMRSPCFLNSDMSCTTCHNPHQTLAQQDSQGIWQCIQCHDAAQIDHTTCAAKHTDGCLNCHMPKVRMEFPVRFTDHWIRVIDSAESDRKVHGQ